MPRQYWKQDVSGSEFVTEQDQPATPKHTISEAQMESRHRQAVISTELSKAIQRAHEQDSNIEILEVVAALLATVDRWLKREMADD